MLNSEFYSYHRVNSVCCPPGMFVCLAIRLLQKFSACANSLLLHIINFTNSFNFFFIIIFCGVSHSFDPDETPNESAYHPVPSCFYYICTNDALIKYTCFSQIIIKISFGTVVFNEIVCHVLVIFFGNWISSLRFYDVRYRLIDRHLNCLHIFSFILK